MATKVVRLAGAGGTDHQHQATRYFDDFFKHRRCTQLLEGQYLQGNSTKDGRRPALLVEGVDAEAGKALDLEGEVDLQPLLVIPSLPVVHDVPDQRVDAGVLQRGSVDGAQVSVDPDQRGGQSRGEMQVGGPVLDAEGEQLGDIHLVVLNSPLNHRDAEGAEN